jgi:signal transduction histidine kinase
VSGVDIGCWTVAALFATLAAFVFALMRSRLSRSADAERLALERRDRFFAVAAGELDAPLLALRGELATLDAWSATPARLSQLTQELDHLREIVSELARVPAPVDLAERVEIDVAEVVREIIAQPPFSDRGPSVILRASPAIVLGDRARLTTGLRVLLWVVRRDVPDGASLVVTVSSDREGVYVEIDTGGVGDVADALERLPAVAYGLTSPAGEPGTALALHVATQIARAHGGRLAASARVGQGERFVLELPRGTSGH